MPGNLRDVGVHPYRRRRQAGPVVVMLLLLLAATGLYSAASAHHNTTIAAHHPAGAALDCTVDHHPGATAPGHEHRHGTEWTPSLGKRARPADPADAPGTTIPAEPESRHCAVTDASVTAASTDVDLSLLSVLRA